MPGQIDARQLDPILEDESYFVIEASRGRNGRRRGAGRQLSEVVLREIEGALGLDVPGQSERRVAGMIVGLEKGADVVELHRADVVSRADGHPMVRVVRGKQGSC